MALTRKMLKAMGINEEQIDQIIEAHTETVEGLKTERDNYKIEAEKVPGLQTELKDAKAQNDDSWKVKYDAIKEDFETYKNEQTAKATKETKEKLYTELLKSAGVSEKRIGTVLKVTSLDSIEIDADGRIKDADKVTEGIKTEWSDFIVTETQRGADTATPPGSNGNETPDFEKMSMSEYAAYRNKKK